MVIVGAGFAGLATAIRLKRHGIEDFVVLDRAEDVGGTWHYNTYPGCICDVPSHLNSTPAATPPCGPDGTWRLRPRAARFDASAYTLGTRKVAVAA